MASAAFSLTMYVGTAMKNPGILGKTDASTTLRPDTPRTRNLESKTALGSPSAPIGHVQLAWCPQASLRTQSLSWASVLTDEPGHVSVNRFTELSMDLVNFMPSTTAFTSNAP